MSPFIEVTLHTGQKLMLNAQLIYMVTGSDSAVIWFAPPGAEIRSTLQVLDSYVTIQEALQAIQFNGTQPKPNLSKGVKHETTKSNRDSKRKHSKEGQGGDSDSLRDGNGGSESFCL